MATRDPEATKARILAAALREFSAKGIAGARVDAIAERAKVNKRMLYYYFGSKEGLFQEILRRRLHERVAGDAEYTRLLLWEALETKPTKPVNAEIRRDFFRSWVEVVRADQAAGRFPTDLDAEQWVLTEVLLALGPMLLPQVTYLVTGRTATDPAFVATRQEFLGQLEARVTGA